MAIQETNTTLDLSGNTLAVEPRVPSTTGLETPSRFSVGQEVAVQFQYNNWLADALVAGVTFTDYGKVFYDIKVPYQESNYPQEGTHTEYTKIIGVDSCFVEPRIAEPAPLTA